MKRISNILIFTIIIPFKLVFPQNYQVGFDLGLVDFKNSDQYLEKIISGPFELFDFNHDYFSTGYVFNKSSFNSNADKNYGINLEYNLSKFISPFVNLTYFKMMSNGVCHVHPVFSGGLGDKNARFKMKSNFYIIQFGTNFYYKIQYFVPFISCKIIFSRIQNNSVELLDVNEDFIKYSYKYTVEPMNNIGLGIGFGIKIPILKILNFFVESEFDNLNLLRNGFKKRLEYSNYSAGVLLQI